MALTLARTGARMGLLHGTLDMLILRILEGKSLHGSAIARVIRERSAGVLEVETGSLYPALQRLVQKHWVSLRSGGTADTKIYSLTAEGRGHLLREELRWTELVEAINAVRAGF